MPRVLVVDDEESIQETFSFFLRKASYEVTTVGSVAEAHDALGQQSYELVFTDVLMPGKTGDTLLERTAWEEEPPTVIIVTGQPDLEAMTEMMRRGAYDYLAKPVRKQTLLTTASRALEHRQLTLSAKRLAKENERYRQHLERLVEERTQALDQTNRQLMSEIEERVAAENFMKRQRDFTVALSRASTQEEMLAAILDAIHSLDGIDASGIHILQDTYEGAPFELLVTRGLPDNFPDYFHSISPGSPMYEILLEGTPIYTDEVSEEFDAILRSPNPAMLQKFSVISMIPVRYDGKTVATLNTCTRESISTGSRRFLEAIAECLGGVIARVSLKPVLDEQLDCEKAAAFDFFDPPFRSWGVWEWEPESDTMFWSYSLCRLLMLTNRAKATPLDDFGTHLLPEDAGTVFALIRNTAKEDSQPIVERTVTLVDSTGAAHPALLICHSPLPERPRCMGIFILMDASDGDAETAPHNKHTLPNAENP